MAEIKNDKIQESDDLVRRVAFDFEELYVNAPMTAGSLPESTIKTLKNRFKTK